MAIVDCHCDVLSRIWKDNDSLYSNRGQFDIKRAQQAGVIVQFCALFAPGTADSSLRAVLNQIDKLYVELGRYSDLLYLLTSFGDFIAHRDKQDIGIVLHLEGGEALGQDPGLLRVFYQLGLRSLGLTWNHRNLLADGVLDDTSGGGLSRTGREVVQLADDLGVIVDLAHISPRAYFDVLEMTSRPVLVSHANSRHICDHPRNLTDDQLVSLAEHGGIVGCTLVPDFIKPGKACPDLTDFVDHIVYISELIGVDHVAVGSDFDGVDEPVLKDVGEWGKLEIALKERGFSATEVEKILQANCLNLIRETLS